MSRSLPPGAAERSITKGSRSRDFAHSAPDTPAGPAPTMTSSAFTPDGSAAAAREDPGPARIAELAANGPRLDQSGASDAAHLEAHVARPQQDGDPAGRHESLEMIGDLRRQPLLELRPAGIVREQPRRPADAHDAVRREVRDRGFAEERREVMDTHRMEAQPTQDDQ